jgi:hypothetical protein
MRDQYIQADITGKEDDIKTKLRDYIASTEDVTLHGAVDYVMKNKPVGVTRVDGYCVEKLLSEISQEARQS